jgi:hypothetical protein
MIVIPVIPFTPVGSGSLQRCVALHCNAALHLTNPLGTLTHRCDPFFAPTLYPRPIKVPNLDPALLVWTNEFSGDVAVLEHWFHPCQGFDKVSAAFGVDEDRRTSTASNIRDSGNVIGVGAGG